jgi:hypothetical protein
LITTKARKMKTWIMSRLSRVPESNGNMILRPTGVVVGSSNHAVLIR